MADCLNFVLDMYLDDDSGELIDVKEDSIDRNFYENNAFSSQVRLVTVHYCGQNAGSNADTA